MARERKESYAAYIIALISLQIGRAEPLRVIHLITSHILIDRIAEIKVRATGKAHIHIPFNINGIAVRLRRQRLYPIDRHPDRSGGERRIQSVSVKHIDLISRDISRKRAVDIRQHLRGGKHLSVAEYPVKLHTVGGRSIPIKSNHAALCRHREIADRRRSLLFNK